MPVQFQHEEFLHKAGEENLQSVVKCYDCGKSFFNEKFYEAHVKRRHSKEDTKHQENVTKTQTQNIPSNHNVINDEELNTKVKDMTNKLLGKYPG